MENLLLAWREFLNGKRKKEDVQMFQYHLSDNIASLHADLKNKVYEHGLYHAFNISDPKPRIIHKASVRDRLLHHAIYRVLYPFFDRRYIHDSYSCRLGKGTHRACKRFQLFAGKVSKNHTRTCWVLKCDVRKFFASIDQKILTEILKRHIKDEDTIWLLQRVIGSFNSGKEGIGLPLGNLTSQLLVNIYMNEFDQFMKHVLKVKYYIRYADDFVILHQDKKKLEDILRYPPERAVSVRAGIVRYLREKLKLELHPDKVFLKTFASGVDFLGWVHFPTYKVLRTSTKKRMFKRLNEKNTDSYLGMLSHGNGYKLQSYIQKTFSNTAVVIDSNT